MLEIIDLRNSLAVGKFGKYERELIDKINTFLSSTKTPFSKTILEAIENCLQDVNKNDFESATREIDLIHNFPLSYNEIGRWDEKHFYHIELLSYVEDVKYTTRIKKLIETLAEAQNNIKNWLHFTHENIYN